MYTNRIFPVVHSLRSLKDKTPTERDGRYLGKVGDGESSARE